MEILGLILLGGIIWGIAVAVARANKRKMLMQKYNDVNVVNKIMGKVIWEGETAEQLIYSLGRPKGVDQKYLKSRTREIWKYGQTSRTRFGLRVTLDNGVVAGWDKKG
jgi:hypothetical protein